MIKHYNIRNYENIAGWILWKYWKKDKTSVGQKFIKTQKKGKLQEMIK